MNDWCLSSLSLTDFYPSKLLGFRYSLKVAGKLPFLWDGLTESNFKALNADN